MCQISVVMEREGGEEKLLDNVTGLDVTGDGIVLRSFFDEPREVKNAHIARIDFLGGKVILKGPPAGAKE
jgi:predicted RNA-binding protein